VVPGKGGSILVKSARGWEMRLLRTVFAQSCVDGAGIEGLLCQGGVSVTLIVCTEGVLSC